MNQYCEKKIAAPGTDFYYSIRFLNPHLRNTAVNLYATITEINEIPLECSDLSVAAKKIDWWQHEIQQLYLNKPQHPCTQAILPIIESYQIPKTIFEETINYIKLRLERPYCVSEQDFQIYSYHHFGFYLMLMDFCINQKGLIYLKYAKSLANCLATCQEIIFLRKKLYTNNCSIPLDFLQQFDLSLSSLEEKKHRKQLVLMLDNLHQKAIKMYQNAIDNIPTNYFSGGFTLAKIYLATLEEISKESFPIFKHQVTITPLRKLWIALRTRKV